MLSVRPKCMAVCSTNGGNKKWQSIENLVELLTRDRL